MHYLTYLVYSTLLQPKLVILLNAKHSRLTFSQTAALSLYVPHAGNWTGIITGVPIAHDTLTQGVINHVSPRFHPPTQLGYSNHLFDNLGCTRCRSHRREQIPHSRVVD